MSSRYQWSSGLSMYATGQPGDIPNIIILPDEQIPPISQAHQVMVNLPHSNEPESSRLEFLWIVGEGELEVAGIILCCPANDPRLKVQYSRDGQPTELVKKIAVLIQDNTTCFFPRNDESRILKINQTLPMEQVPETIKSFVDQVRVWRDFVAQHRNALAIYGSRLHLDQEDGCLYYVAATTSRFFFVPPAAPDEDTWQYELVETEEEMFRFDPKETPPIVMEDGAIWKIPDKKVIVALPHKSAMDKVAAYYDYSGTLTYFRQCQQQHEQEELAKERARWKREQLENQQQREVIEQALLS